MQEFFQNTPDLFFIIFIIVLSFLGILFTAIGTVLVRIHEKMKDSFDQIPTKNTAAFEAVGKIFKTLGPLMLLGAATLGYFWWKYR